MKKISYNFSYGHFALIASFYDSNQHNYYCMSIINS